MKQVEEQAKENVRATSSKGAVVRPWDSIDARKKAASKRRRESCREMRRRQERGLSRMARRGQAVEVA
jgi:hypothetical protein